jgi:chromatin segregation and condensation protein Rec8/ScpA/Scc1 (kleisin family)
MRRLISSLVNLLSSSRSIPPSMLNPQNTRHYLLRGRAVFQALPLGSWGERAVAFAALLEAHRLGLLRLHQEAPFAPLHVEVLQERQELSA